MYEFAWIIFTLLTVSAASLAAKKWGSEILITFIVVCTVIANILASKLINMFGFIVPAGVIIYSISFTLTDTLSEFFGKDKALKAVWLGFFANLLLYIFLFIGVKWPHALGEEAGQAFSEVMSLSERITVAALFTYLVSQLHDVWAYDYWMKKTNGRYLWLRNNASTIVSQMIDTILFISIAFWGIMPVAPLIIGQLSVKIIIAIIDTAFLYGLKRFVFNDLKAS